MLFLPTDGIRIAASATVESLLLSDFDLVINDVTYRVVVPLHHKSTLVIITLECLYTTTGNYNTNVPLHHYW